MSAMKDYLKWLESKGIAEFDEFQDEWHFTVEDPESEELIEQYNADDDWPNPQGWSPEDFWFNGDGGLTGDALDYLYDCDIKGEFS